MVAMGKWWQGEKWRQCCSRHPDPLSITPFPPAIKVAIRGEGDKVARGGEETPASTMVRSNLSHITPCARPASMTLPSYAAA